MCDTDTTPGVSAVALVLGQMIESLSLFMAGQGLLFDAGTESNSSSGPSLKLHTTSRPKALREVGPPNPNPEFPNPNPNLKKKKKKLTLIKGRTARPRSKGQEWR